MASTQMKHCKLGNNEWQETYQVAKPNAANAKSVDTRDKFSNLWARGKGAD